MTRISHLKMFLIGFPRSIGDRWNFVNVLPRSGFIHTVHHGKRSEEEAGQFVQKIKQDSDGRAPLFISDGWKYEQVLKNNYCHYDPVSYSGRGRPRNPLQVVDPEVKYKKISSAMVEGLTNKHFTMEELLMWKIPLNLS